MFKVVDWDGTDDFNLLDPVTGEYYYLENFVTISSKGTCREVMNQVSGLTQLAGLEVDYSYDGGDGGTVNVSAGGVADLDYYGNKIMIGIPYNSYFTPMNIAPAKNQKKRVVSIMAEVYKSIGGKAGKDIDHLDPFPTNDVIVLDAPAALNTGAQKIPFRGGSTYNGDIMIMQDRPLPQTVLSLIAEVEIGE